MTLVMTETWHKDASGRTRPNDYVGKMYFHPKTQRLYTVTGFGVDSERELWLLHYVRCHDEEGFTYHHTIGDFTREGRFVEVKK